MSKYVYWKNLSDNASVKKVLGLHSGFFFQNKRIFVQLDELDELDKIAHA